MATKTKNSNATAAPGKVLIRYLFDHYSADWGAPELHKQGKEMEVDAAKATKLAKEYGPAQRGKIFNDRKDAKAPLPGEKITELGCPFEIVASGAESDTDNTDQD